MEWLAKMRRKSMAKAMWIFLLAAGFAAVMLFGSGAIGIFKTLSPKSLEDLTPETAVGKYVETDIYVLYGSFIDDLETRSSDKYSAVNVVGRYYLIDFDEETYYMGLHVHKKELPEFETMMENCAAAFEENLDWNEVPVIRVKGTITAMNDKELGFYRDAVGDGEDMLPFYLDLGRMNGQTVGGMVLIWVISLAVLALGVLYMLKAGNQKEIKRLLEASGNFEREAERAAAFFENTEPVCGVRMNEDFVYFRAGQKDVLLRPWDVVWAHKSTTRHKLYGIIPVGKSFATTIHTMDGKTYTLPMSEQKVNELLNTMFTAIPGVALGYSEQLANAYANYRQVFADRWEEKVPGCTTRYKSVRGDD